MRTRGGPVTETHPVLIRLNPVEVDQNEFERVELLREIAQIQDELIRAHLEIRRLSALNENLKNRARGLGAKI